MQISFVFEVELFWIVWEIRSEGEKAALAQLPPVPNTGQFQKIENKEQKERGKNEDKDNDNGDVVIELSQRSPRIWGAVNFILYHRRDRDTVTPMNDLC